MSSVIDRVKSKFGKKRVFILGLDGTPIGLLQDLIHQGAMPNLGELVSKGDFKAMTTSIPEVSSVAWTTFFTGLNPGGHGIFGFTALQPGSYKLMFPNYRNVNCPTLWDISYRRGRKRTVALNIPSTYPARRLHGVMVAGFVALDLQKATYPPEALPLLRKLGYLIDVDTAKVRESLDLLEEQLTLTLARREDAIRYFSQKEEWDLFIAVITGTDRLHHFLWEAWADANHPRHEFFVNYYRRLDEVIGRTYENIASKAAFLMMSDHGFCAIEKEVYLNCWLKEQGYLDFVKNPPESLEDIAPGSRAMAMDPSRIYINLKDTYPAGAVAPGDEYRALRRELKEKFSELSYNGKRIIRRVFFKEELYRGPFVQGAPDLILLSEPGFDLKGAVGRTEVFGNSNLTGMHTQNDAFLFGLELQLKPDPNIIDMAPTVLQLMGIKPPAELEGRSLSD